MDAESEEERVSIRAREGRRRGLAAPDIPLGIKLVAILIVLDAIGGLVGAALAPFQSQDVPGRLTGIPGVVVGVAIGLLFILLGRYLYRGSRIALDVLIGGYIAFLIFGLLMERWASVGPTLLALGIYGGFLAYLLHCRGVLSKLEKSRRLART